MLKKIAYLKGLFWKNLSKIVYENLKHMFQFISQFYIKNLAFFIFEDFDLAPYGQIWPFIFLGLAILTVHAK